MFKALGIQEVMFSYQEKSTLLNLIGTLVISGIFWLYIYSTYPQQSLDSTSIFKYWGYAFVLLIAASVVLKVIASVVFSVANEVVNQEKELAPDERDVLIELKATKISFYLFTVGLALSVGTQALGWPPTAMFVLLICSAIVAEVVGDISKLYFYQRGF